MTEDAVAVADVADVAADANAVDQKQGHNRSHVPMGLSSRAKRA